MTELSSRYSPEIESKWYQIWESKGYFKPRSDREGKDSAQDRYVIVIPPPNVTGILHMGHALNNSIQDVMIRYNRMLGKDTLWVPGVDHAGIATQNVVEKQLAKEKIKRQDIGREKFLEKVWAWKEEHGNTITHQLRKLGASCDWSRERFTMDPGLSKSVRECFVRLYEDGLIYQGHYIINWCPRCQTALSDEESEHKETKGGFYHIRYKIAGKGDACAKENEDHIVIATTRPETMLGDTAVAVNPEDERYKHLIGEKLILPLIGREIPIIADSYVDQEFGTGLVKVTPAHDPNDFEMGKRHNLPEINVMHPDGKINENGGNYKGMDRFEARKKIIKDLEEQALFIKKEAHTHSVGRCYRCDTIVEPYLSKQWFVKMQPMAERALREHKAGKTKFYPDRWTKVYTNWLEGIRDWCISRQIWWGHQIPVWYCENPKCVLKETEAPPFFVSRDDLSKCPECGSADIKQDPDVLDTWFSSWLWPFSTLGWPDEESEDLNHFYPTSDLSTAPEIIFFWVARMIMAGVHFKREVPFSRIYLHGTVRAEGGLKMSKSLGNSIDPLEVIEEMGADALRFSMIMLSAQDVYISRNKFEVGRNFNNKLWNASRFTLMNLEDYKEGSLNLEYDPKSLPITARWILSRLETVTEVVNKHMAGFGLAQATSELYHFVWNDFCDWYIELTKPALTGSDVELKKQTQAVLFFVLERSLKLLHPFIPFITEEIWQILKGKAKDGEAWPETIMIAPWPTGEGFRDSEAEKYFKALQDAMTGLRDVRANINIPPSQKLEGVISVQGENLKQIFEAYRESLEKLGKFSLQIESDFKASKGYVGNAFSDFKVFIHIEGVVDPEKERPRIEKKIEEIQKYVASLNGKLSNENFIKNAKPEIVDRDRQNLEDAEKKLKAQLEQLELFK